MCRFQCNSRYTSKVHTYVDIQESLYLDDIMLHKVKKDSKHLTKMYRNEKSSDYLRKYKYNLYAIIQHIGEIISGHYVTFVKYKYQNNKQHWVMFDGSVSCLIKDEKINTLEGVYQLFYERDDQWKNSTIYQNIEQSL